MLSAHKQEVDDLKIIFQQIFKSIQTINAATKPLSRFFRGIIHLITFIFCISILFKDQNIFPPQIINQSFRLILLSKIESNYGISFNIVIAVVIIFSTLTIALMIAHTIRQSSPKIISKVLKILINVSFILCVPLTDVAGKCWMDVYQGNGSRELKILTILLIAILVLFCGVYINFNIQIFRYRNEQWSNSNDPQFFTYCLQISKVIYIYRSGVTVMFGMLALIAESYKREIKGGCYSEKERNCLLFQSNLIGGTYVAVMIKLLWKHPQHATFIWGICLAFSIFSLIGSLIRTKDETLSIPLCDAHATKFYEFYFEFVKKYQTEIRSPEKTYGKVCNFHLQQCLREKCKVRSLDDPSHISHKEIQRLVEQYIKQQSRRTLEGRFLLEMWNLQIHQTCDIDFMTKKSINLEQQFIVVGANQKMKQYEVVDHINLTHASLKKAFYDSLQECSEEFYCFYTEMHKKEPKISKILKIGQNIKGKIQKFKSVYLELIKKKHINFKMIEINSRFFTNFLYENTMTQAAREKLTQIQKLNYFESISESYLPTLALNSKTGAIENINCQGQKFLLKTKFQLKKININQIILPQVSLESLKQFCKEEQSTLEEEIYVFFKIQERQFKFGKIIVSEKEINIKKKQFIIQVQMVKFSDQKNMFLVNEEFEIIEILRKQVQIRDLRKENSFIIKSWLSIFEEFIKINKNSLLETKIQKIEINIQNISLVLKLLKTPDKKYYIIQALLINSIQSLIDSKPRKRSSILDLLNLDQQPFQFSYGRYNETKTVKIYGDVPQAKKNNGRNSDSEESEYVYEQNRRKIEMKNEKKKIDYEQDIKTYRLHEKQLYNVDLEDKAAYEQQFQAHQTENVQQKHHGSQCIMGISILIGLICLSMITLNVLTIVKFADNLETLNTSFVRNLNIKSSFIDFIKILGTLRDVGYDQSLIHSKEFSHIFDSQARIKAFPVQTRFTNQTYTIQLAETNLTGSLNELMNVILAYSYDFTKTLDFEIIQRIHTACFTKLNTLMFEQNQAIEFSIETTVSSSIFYKNIKMFIQIVVIIFYNILIVVYCMNNHSTNKGQLKELMSTSENQLEQSIENAEKMKYLAELLKKNPKARVDIKINLNQFKNRKKVKNLLVGNKTIYSTIILIITILTIHLALLYLSSSILNSKMNDFLTTKEQGLSVLESYSELTDLSNSIDHLGEVNMTKLMDGRNRIYNMLFQRNQSLFSPELSNYINTLFFNDSCPTLLKKYNYSLADCYNSTPGYYVSSPFKIGFAYYFLKESYYLIDNNTETFAVTGIKSQPFARVFTNLSELIKGEGLNFLSTAFTDVNNIYIVEICMYCIDALIFVLLWLHLKRKSEKINQISEFFHMIKVNKTQMIKKNHKGKSKHQEKQVQEKIDHDSEDQFQEKGKLKSRFHEQ